MLQKVTTLLMRFVADAICAVEYAILSRDNIARDKITQRNRRCDSGLILAVQLRKARVGIYSPSTFLRE